MARAWYCYTRTGSISRPENYVYSVSKPTCVAGRIPCCIYALYCGPHQCVISSNLQAYAAACSATGLAQPMIPVGAKKYIYCLPN